MTDATPRPDWRDTMNDRFSRLFGGHPAYADVDEGWADVVLDLLAEVDLLVPADDESFRVTDIKSKWCGLRFYHTGGDDVEAAVDRANERASRTCETCGAPGTVHGRGWYVVACATHAPRDGGAA